MGATATSSAKNKSDVINNADPKLAEAAEFFGVSASEITIVKNAGGKTEYHYDATEEKVGHYDLSHAAAAARKRALYGVLEERETEEQPATVKEDFN